MRTTLTAFVPAHKQTDPQHAPGQIVNPVNPLGFVDQTLGDYIRRKDKIHEAFDAIQQEHNAVATEKKKLTFAAWWEHNKEALQLGGPAPRTIAHIIWMQAQENV